MNSEVLSIEKAAATALSSTLGLPNVKVELEVRFSYPNFTELGVPHQVWTNLYNTLTNIPESDSYAISKFSQKMKDVIVNMNNNTLRRTSGLDTKAREMVKHTFKTIINKQQSYKTAISTEKSGFSNEELKYFNTHTSSVIRIKERFSFYVGAYLRVDMTIIKPKYKKSKHRKYGSKPPRDISIYEIELELRVSPDKPRAIEILMLGIGWLTKNLHRTTIRYTLTERNRLVKFLNGAMGEPRTGGVNYGIYNFARDLKYDDLVDGGILGYSDVLKKNIGYTTTHKADGKRKMLVVYGGTIYYVTPPYYIDKVKYNYEGPDVVLDGEEVIIKPKFDNAGKIIYLIIDVISMSKENWLERHAYALKISEDLRKSGLMVYTKNFEVFYTADSFFEINKRLLDLSDSLAFKTDGLIYTPINNIYQNKSSRPSKRGRGYTEEIPPGERTLRTWPDIIKYKIPKDLTVDLGVELSSKRPGKHAGRQGEVFLQVTLLEGGLGIFSGTRRNPFRRSMINHKELLSHVGKIVEFEWREGKIVMKNGKPVQKEGKLVVRNIREFKPFPNRSDIAREIWNNMRDPITVKTITGENLVLMFKNNNRIKMELIMRMDKGSMILDIGSGIGGDIGKWSKAKLDRVYALEPNQDRVEVLRKRIEDSGLNDLNELITIIPYAAEDVKKIDEALGGRKVDYITSMFSLSFFKDFKTIRTLLSRFLKPTGSFIYFTIDGDAVLETFKPRLDITGRYKSIDSFKYGDFSLERVVDALKITDDQSEVTGDELTVGDDDEEIKAGLSTGGEEEEIKESKIDSGSESQLRSDSSEADEVYIDIKGSKTAEHQKEYLVNITRLHKELGKDGYISSFRKRADKETFMSIDAFRVSNLYSYGVFVSSSVNKSTYSLIRRMKSIGKTVHPFDQSLNEKYEEDSEIPVVSRERIPVFYRTRRLQEEEEEEKISETVVKPMFYLPKRKGELGKSREKVGDVTQKDFTDEKATIPDYSAIHLQGESDRDPILSLVETEQPPHPLPTLTRTRKQLPSMSEVQKMYPRKVLPVTPNITMKVAMGDDLNDQLSDKNFIKIKVFRIAVIDEGYSLIHSILKATNYIYQRNDNYFWRRDLSRNLSDSLRTADIEDIARLMNIGIYVITPYKDNIDILEKYDGYQTIVLSWTTSWEVIAVELDKTLYQTVFNQDDPFIRILDEMREES